MRFLISVAISLLVFIHSYCQKLPINMAVFDKWPYIESCKISDDGQRIFYSIFNPAEMKTSIYLYTTAINQHQKLDSVPQEFREENKVINKPEALSQNPNKQKQSIHEGVDVWSYMDPKLQSQQIKEINESGVEHVFSVTKNYALVASSDGSDYESNWNSASLKTIYLVSLKDGKRQVLDNRVGGLFQYIYGLYWILPGEKFVIYYDPLKKDYFSYEISSRIKRNISASVKTTWTTYVKRDVPMANYMPVGFAGSVENDEAVLIYDQQDIFQIDPLCKKEPINLTNQYGLINNIVLRFALDDKKMFQPNESVILSGFNRWNKNDGFYRMHLGESKKPQLLCVGPYTYKGSPEDDRFYTNSPIKAKDANVYVVWRSSAEDSPNLFWTKDFKVFNRITDIHPEDNYNWLKTCLVTWKLPDGSPSQGILYKPENFDSQRRYPLIFYYYENSSEGLHGFLKPESTKGTLNIPYYVSNGYLVFTPDMHYKIGHPGQSVVKTIVSAALYLSKKPWVDSKHMGIQGHSRGGWETNFIVTHTNIFAAAMSASGMSDYVSLNNGIRILADGRSRNSGFEYGYQRIGTSLWQRPDLFIENSPIFRADNVTTPILMMSNKEDNDVPFEQGIEFFTALRRLGKRAWMLQYDGEGHMVFDKASEDLEVRMKQFFDHYLKDSACPKWMLYGVPATKKGNPDALQLVYEKDKNGKWLTPKEGGLLIDEEKKKVEALKKRKPVTVTIE